MARTHDQRRDGLTNTKNLAPDGGMLFVFDARAPQEVWMADMRIPLDIAWILEDKIIATDTLELCTEPEDQSTCPRWASPGDVDALLEVRAGALTAITPNTTLTVKEQTR